MKTKLLLTLLAIFNLQFAISNLQAQAPNWAWAQRAGIAYSHGNSVETDASGNVYITGNYDGGGSWLITFGSDTVLTKGLFIVKYDAFGSVVWAKSNTDLWAFGISGGATGFGGYADSNGNVYVTGRYNGTIIFGTDTLIESPEINLGNADVFIAKYDTNGNPLWAKSVGSYGDEQGNDITSDNGGNVIVTGYYDSPVISIGSSSIINLGGRDIFAIKYDGNGNVIWAKSAGGSSNDEGTSLKADPSGNIYITGKFLGASFPFGSTTLSTSTISFLILKYDANGNPIWAKSTSTGSAQSYGNCVTTDNSGNIFVTGYFIGGNLIIGTSTLTNSVGFQEMFIAKYNSSGTLLWVKNETSGGSYGLGVATDNAGNIFVSGSGANALSSQLDFGGVNLLNNVNDIFVVKYNTNGTALWAKGIVTCDYSQANDINVDGFGNIFVTGFYGGSALNFGITILLNPTGTGTTFFVAKLNNYTAITEYRLSTFSLTPNPTTGELRIINYELSIKEIKIYDLLGQEILKQIQNDKSVTIDLTNVSNGIYFVEIKTEKGIVNKKIVKQ